MTDGLVKVRISFDPDNKPRSLLIVPYDMGYLTPDKLVRRRASYYAASDFLLTALREPALLDGRDPAEASQTEVKTFEPPLFSLDEIGFAQRGAVNRLSRIVILGRAMKNLKVKRDGADWTVSGEFNDFTTAHLSLIALKNFLRDFSNINLIRERIPLEDLTVDRETGEIHVEPRLWADLTAIFYPIEEQGLKNWNPHYIHQVFVDGSRLKPVSGPDAGALKLSFEVIKEGDHLHITLTDNGQGFDPRQYVNRAGLIERLKTKGADGKYSMHNKGLATYNLVNELFGRARIGYLKIGSQGTVTVENGRVTQADEYYPGTRIYMSIPLKEEDGQTVIDLDAAQAQTQAVSESVLDTAPVTVPPP